MKYILLFFKLIQNTAEINQPRKKNRRDKNKRSIWKT